MSNVVPFAPKPRGKSIVFELPMLDHRKWQCGGCHESTTFHIWCDGVVACSECGAETAGLIAKLTDG